MVPKLTDVSRIRVVVHVSHQVKEVNERMSGLKRSQWMVGWMC